MAHRPCRTTGAVRIALLFYAVLAYSCSGLSVNKKFGGATGATRGARPCAFAARQSPTRRVHAAARCQAEQTTDFNASPVTLQRRALLSASSILGVPSPHTLHRLAAKLPPPVPYCAGCLAAGLLFAAGGAPGPAGAAECTLTTAPNGIAFCDTREGTGQAPKAGSLIRLAACSSDNPAVVHGWSARDEQTGRPCRCHYRGKLASNNAVFDSSYERGRPLTFKARPGSQLLPLAWLT